MLVRANYGAIEVEFLKIAISGQFRKDCSPHSAICQPGEAAIHAVPAAEPWGQVAPRSACPGHPENSLNEQPVISGCPPRVRWFARQ